MKTIELIRINNCNGGMQGVLKYEHRVFAVTLEPPWRDNERNVSCIPAGPYSVRLGMSPKRKYEVWWIREVADRTNVQMHKGDGLEDTEGCVIVADQFDVLQDGSIKVWQSSHAWGELMDRIKPDTEFALIIRDRYL